MPGVIMAGIGETFGKENLKSVGIDDNEVGPGGAFQKASRLVGHDSSD